jgi:hypothetical protein
VDRLALRRLREGDDDHFYGPWKGGSKASGGRPGGSGEAQPFKKADYKPGTPYHGPDSPEDPEYVPPHKRIAWSGGSADDPIVKADGKVNMHGSWGVPSGVRNDRNGRKVAFGLEGKEVDVRRVPAGFATLGLSDGSTVRADIRSHGLGRMALRPVRDDWSLGPQETIYDNPKAAKQMGKDRWAASARLHAFPHNDRRGINNDFVPFEEADDDHFHGAWKGGAKGGER